MGYITRTAEQLILKMGQSFPCLAVYGPRQVGKSTTVEHLFGAEFRKVTLDDLQDRHAALQNPREFLESYGWPLIIDEIQKAPDLLSVIKQNVDEQRLLRLKNNRPRELMYVLTGSSRYELRQGIAESLAGRCGIIELSSFSRAEKYGRPAVKFNPDLNLLLQRERELGSVYCAKSAVFEDIFAGGMPEICNGAVSPEIYHKSYISTYLEKDVMKLIAAGSELKFRNFLSVAALHTAQELHLDTIAATVGIDVRTCGSWLSILESSGLVFLLQPFHSSLSRRLIKAPKLYFMDTGLCAQLCGWPAASMLERCAMNGAFFETYVVSEIIKNLCAFGEDPRQSLFYYRDIDKKEVDLLYVKEQTIYPIEIKTNLSPHNPIKNFGVLDKFKLKVAPGLIIDTGDKLRPLNKQAYSYPVSLLGL